MTPGLQTCSPRDFTSWRYLSVLGCSPDDYSQKGIAAIIDNSSRVANPSIIPAVLQDPSLNLRHITCQLPRGMCRREGVLEAPC